MAIDVYPNPLTENHMTRQMKGGANILSVARLVRVPIRNSMIEGTGEVWKNDTIEYESVGKCGKGFANP